jgi:hypothetical protein
MSATSAAVHDLFDLAKVGRDVGDGLLAERPARLGQTRPVSTVCHRGSGFISTQPISPAAASQWERRLRHLEGAASSSGVRPSCHPHQVIQHGKMRDRHPLRQPRLEPGAAELFDDPDLVEEPEDRAAGRRHASSFLASRGQRGVAPISGP